MAAPFISLGLKAANSLVDKHFEKIPDKYMHSDAYAPKNLPNPLTKKKKKRKGTEDQEQDTNESRSASPSSYTVDDADSVPIRYDIPKHSGASLDDFISPPGPMPQQYSTAPPHIRPEYIPPPPIGMTYPSPPPPQPNGQFPPQPTYNQFPPPPRNQYYPPSPPSTADPSRDRRHRGDREQRHSDRGRRREGSSDDDRRGLRPKNSRRSSSYEPPYEKHVTRYKSHENGEESQTEEYYRSTRRPKNHRRSSSHQPSRNQELFRYTTNDEGLSDVSSRRPKTSSGSQAPNPYDDQYDTHRSRASRRPRMVTRRSSSYHGRDSNNYYPPSTRDNGRQRRASVSSSKRYSGFDDSRSHTSDHKEGAPFFTKSKEGLLSGALGAVVGGWATQRVQRSASGRDGKRGSGKRRGHDQEDDKLLTLLGAAVGGLAVNAVVEHMEESKVKKERVEHVKRDSRVYEWDDGYA